MNDLIPLIAVAIGVLVVVKKGFRMCPLGGLAPRRPAAEPSFSYWYLDANPEPSVFLSGSENRINRMPVFAFLAQNRPSRPTDPSVPSADPSASADLIGAVRRPIGAIRRPIGTVHRQAAPTGQPRLLGVLCWDN